MIRSTTRIALIAVAIAAYGAVPARAATYPAGFQEQTTVGGLTGPVSVAWTPDGRGFLTEKAGRLKVIAPGGSTATTILDISSKVNNNGDRGLLDVAVDSSFATNRYLYLLYTHELSPLTPDQGGQMVSRLTRIQVNPDNSLVNPSAPETVLLGSYVQGPCPTPSNTVDCIPSEGLSHSIGSVRSAPDGTLWVGSGDAADYGRVDPLALRTYDEQSLAGKIMHVDRNGKGIASHPFCPTNANLDHVCTKLHSKGFRNPFRFMLRPGGGLTLGDVGWNTREEVDLIPTAAGSGGRNYGWPCYEGTIRTPGYKDLAGCAPEYAKEGTANADVGPNHDYPHTGSAAVVGGPTYSGDSYPAGYRNSIFFGDYGAGFLKRLVVDSQDRVTSVQDFANDWSGTDLEQAPDGNLAYVAFGNGSAGSGSLKKIVYSPGNGGPTAMAGASPTFGAAPLAVQFNSTGSADPDGDSLRYDWDFGDGSAHSTAAAPSHTYSNGGRYTARLTVDDGRGKSASATVQITVGGTPPVPKIDAPADESPYRDGQTIQLQGSATDSEDGNIPASGLSWQVRLIHDTHVHPLQDFDGVANPSFQTRRDHDADSHYEVTLTARDSSGSTASKTIQLRPETVPFTIDSSPAGAPVSYGGRSVTAPFSTQSAIGFDTTVSAAAEFEKNGRLYRFSRWSDGGARLHDVRIPASASTLTATYSDAGPASLVGAWGFDEGAGASVVDSSPRGNNGTIRTATWSVAGRFGKALHFNGGDDMVSVPDASSLDLAEGMTLEAWVKPEDNASWRSVLMKEAPGPDVSYALYSTSENDRPSGWQSVTDVTGPSPLPQNAWSHLALTYDRQTMRLFVNGAEVANRPYTLPIFPSDLPFRIGGNTLWTFETFKGLIDEVRVYNRARSTPEIVSDRDTSIAGGAPPDTTAPTVSLTAPANGATVSGTTNVTATASDNVGVQSVQFKLDGQDLGAADTSSPYSTSWNTATASNGQHTLTAVARDAAGNTKTAANVTVTVSNATSPTGLVGAWAFDEGSGTTAGDKSGKANIGSLVGGPTWTAAGKFGAAITFDGVDDRVSVLDSSSLDPTSAVTLEAWVKPSNSTAWRDVLFKQDTADLAYGLYSTSDTNVPSGWIGSFGTMSTAPLALNTWTHLAMTYDRQNVRVYVNGVLKVTRAYTAAIPVSSGPFLIGWNPIWPDEGFKGQIDEVRVYDKTLTAAQIVADRDKRIGP